MSKRRNKSIPKPQINRDQGYWDRLIREIRNEEYAERYRPRRGFKGDPGTWEEGDPSFREDTDRCE